MAIINTKRGPKLLAMIQIRHSKDRGETRTDWLESRHSFSFGGYRDPRQMGFGRLRVINEDLLVPGSGFGVHPHRDMEILTFMERGSLEHRDSIGNGSLIQAGDVQRMTAGTGVRHSEFNPSEHDDTRLLQVWIEPEERDLPPSYEQRSFGDGWQLVASRMGRGGSLAIHQDVEVHRAKLTAGEGRSFALAPGRSAWIQIIRGDVRIDGEVGDHLIGAGDGAALSDESKLEITSLSSSHLLLFDLPPLERAQGEPKCP